MKVNKLMVSDNIVSSNSDLWDLSSKKIDLKIGHKNLKEKTNNESFDKIFEKTIQKQNARIEETRKEDFSRR